MDEVAAVRPRSAHDLRLDPSKHPGWTNGMERLPSPGEAVETNEGSATVVRVLGRTGSGGRLLELRMADGRKAPFFAAADNVMVRPLDAVEPGPPVGEARP